MIAQEHHNVLGFKCCNYVYFFLLYHFSAWTAHAVFFKLKFNVLNFVKGWLLQGNTAKRHMMKRMYL